MSAYANVYFKTICECIRQINIHRSEVHCGSAFEPGGSSLPYYCTPPVCVPAVLGALAVWRLSKKKKPNIPTSPVSSFPVEDHLGGTPLWACSGENYDWSAAWGSACLGLYVCIFCLCQWRLVCAVLADVDPVGLASVSIKDGTA